MRPATQDVIRVTGGGANASENRLAHRGQQSQATLGSGVIDQMAFRCTGLAEMLARLTARSHSVRQRMVNDQGLCLLFLMNPNDVKIELCFSNAEARACDRG